MQERLMKIDAVLMKKIEKKMARAMAYLSDAAVDATYVSRFDEKVPGWITKEAKNVQQLSSKMRSHFKAKAPMEIWDEQTHKITATKKTVTWRDKR